MKRFYLSPSIKLRQTERIMLDLSSDVGGPQLTEDGNFGTEDDFDAVPTSSASSVWDEADIENQTSAE